MTEFMVGLSSGICFLYPIFYLKWKLYQFRFGDFLPKLLTTFNFIIFFDNKWRFNIFETLLIILGALGLLTCLGIETYYSYRRWKMLRENKD